MRGQATVFDNATFSGATLASPTVTGVPKGMDFILGQWGYAFIHVSSGSIGNNGALTGITALSRIYNEGAYVWYPANSIAAATPAGWYWTVFSSTTAGTIYNSTYTTGVPGPGTLTAFATTGPGAFTGDTGEVFGPTITVPANQLGPNGGLEIYALFAANNTAGAKTSRIRYSGNAGSIYHAVSLASNLAEPAFIGICNRGAASQVGTSSTQAGGLGVGASSNLSTSTVDTTVATTVVYSLQKAVATDNHILDAGWVKSRYGA